MPGIPALALVVTVAGLVAACGAEPRFIEPTSTPGGGGDSATVQRAGLVVTVRVSGADSALAARLGSPGGVLRGAVVTVRRSASAASSVDTTDAAGQAGFEGLLPGGYTVSVLRSLTGSEVAALDSADRDVSGFGGGTTVQVAPPSATTAVAVQAGRRGGLVISELNDNTPILNGAVYNLATFVEVYNNSDTTIYLDGKILGVGLYWNFDCSTCLTPRSCADVASYMLDSLGLWSRYHARFPGTGREYALGPGQAVVVATDAVDHRVADFTLPDLRFASFEYVGSSDADNPSVPNMIELSPDEPFWQIGHGMMFGVYPITFLADTLTLEALPRATILPRIVAYPQVRFPRAKILDVFATAGTPEYEARRELPLCPQWISPVFDRQTASLHDQYDGRTIVRRPFTTLPDGWVILLRTRASANDFELAGASTPGRIP